MQARPKGSLLSVRDNAKQSFLIEKTKWSQDINKLFLLVFFLVFAVFIVFSSVPNYRLSKRQQNWKADGDKERNIDGVPARKKK